MSAPAAGAEAGNALEADVRRAREGSRAALERVVAATQGPLYNLALRMLWHPQDAEDATQEIQVRIITHLAKFRGESAFMTWAYRVAANYLRSTRRGRMERERLTFHRFGEELAQTAPEPAAGALAGVERALLLEEVRVGCTLGMLLCLGREERLTFILGEILELGHAEGAAILEIAPAAFRKRLSRARQRVIAFTRARCGLVEPDNPCRCHHRLGFALAAGRLDPQRLLHARHPGTARAFPGVLEQIRRLDAAQRAVALYRAQGETRPGGDFTGRVRAMLATLAPAAPPVSP